MSIQDYFFVIFLATILITRIFLYFKPIASPKIKGFRLHHYMYGIILIILGLLSNTLTVYAIGFGLFIDELTFIMIKGKSHKDNYSNKSLIGTAGFIIITFMLKSYLTIPFK